MNTSPQVTQIEIESWEQKFREQVSASVQFDKDENGNSSLKMYNGESGLEVSWDGTIQLGSDNFLKWTLSIKYGIYVEMKLNINEDNYELITKIYNFYKIWKRDWSKNLVQSSADLETAQTNTEAPPITIQESFFNTNKKKKISKQQFIDENRDKMKTLAGL